MKYVVYGVTAFIVGALVVGCSSKKAETAAYIKGCERGIGEVLTQFGYTPNPEPIRAFCEKESAPKEAE